MIYFYNLVNHAIKAKDTVNNNTERSFSYTILNRAPVINTAQQLLQTFYSGNAVPSTTISAYDPDGGSVSYSISSGSLPSGLSIVSANGTIVGTPVDVVTNTTSSFSVTATDVGNDSNVRSFTMTITPISDPYYRYVTTLIQGNATSNNTNNSTFIDSSPNNFTMTRYGTVSQGTFSPFNPNGYAYYIPYGTYVTYPRDDNLALSTVDFSIEADVCRTGAPGGRGWPCVMLNHANGQWLEFGFGNSIYANNPNSVVGQFGMFAGDGGFAWSTNALDLHRWYHCKVAREGGRAKVWIDGELQANVAWYGGSTDFGTTITDMKIGFDGYDYSWDKRYYEGFVGNIVIKKAGVTVFSTEGHGGWWNKANANSDIVNISYSGSTPVVTQSYGNINVSSWSANTHGGSAYFDGAGSSATRLETPSNAAFAVGDVFTMEGFFYPYSQSGNLFRGATNMPQIGWQNTGAWGLAEAYVTWAFTSGTMPKLNAWNHFALVRTGRSTNQTALFLNGNRIALGTVSQLFTTTGVMAIGADFNGYMGSSRIVKGYALYDPAATRITVPTGPLTAVTGTSLLLNFTNLTPSGLYDSAGKNTFESVGTVKSSTSDYKYGTGSVNLSIGDAPASGSYLKSGPMQYAHAFRTYDFTVEGWIKLNTLTFDSSATAMIAQYGNGGANGPLGTYTTWAFGVLNGGTGLRLYRYDGTEYNNDFSTTFSTGQWYHVAVCRSGTSLKAFVGGTQIGSTITNSVDYSDVCGTNRLWLGIFSGGGGNAQYYRFPGLIDDFRVTRYARYTTNFTAPVRGFPVQ